MSAVTLGAFIGGRGEGSLEPGSIDAIGWSERAADTSGEDDRPTARGSPSGSSLGLLTLAPLPVLIQR